MTSPEMNLLNQNNARVPASPYWLGSPYGYSNDRASGRNVSATGYGSGGNVVLGLVGVRPSVSLTTGTEYTSGDGSMTDPYIIE